jgi:hypothetical protein
MQKLFLKTRLLTYDVWRLSCSKSDAIAACSLHAALALASLNRNKPFKKAERPAAAGPWHSQLHRTD